MNNYFSIEHPVIEKAISDLRGMLSTIRTSVKDVMLFGSTLRIPIDEAKDIDFLIDYDGTSFSELKQHLENLDIGRNVVVQHLEMGYANCPTWDKTEPLTLHILFYQKGKSKLSPKAIETEKYALNITDSVFKN